MVPHFFELTTDVSDTSTTMVSELLVTSTSEVAAFMSSLVLFSVSRADALLFTGGEFSLGLWVVAYLVKCTGQFLSESWWASFPKVVPQGSLKKFMTLGVATAGSGEVPVAAPWVMPEGDAPVPTTVGVWGSFLLALGGHATEYISAAFVDTRVAVTIGAKAKECSVGPITPVDAATVIDPTMVSAAYIFPPCYSFVRILRVLPFAKRRPATPTTEFPTTRTEVS